MAAVFDRYPVGGGEFVLALALADNAHDDGTHIFPKVRTMAEKSRQTERSVQRHLDAMQARGWLEQTRPGGGRGRPAEYRINADWLKGGNLSPFTPVDNSVQKGDIAPPERVTFETEKGDIGDTTNRTGRNHTPLPPKGGVSAVGCGLVEVADAYPRKRSDTERAAVVWNRLQPSAALAEEILRAVKALAGTPEWQAEGGRFAPKLSKFLRNKAWQMAPVHVVRAPAPSPSPAPRLSAQQMAENKARARALAEASRLAIAQRRLAVGERA